jgi:nitroimidazol reductase NimA-like FMN-containing flavoprotein (pyridoxamine 5'-phosphate oxidase superfamily)
MADRPQAHKSGSISAALTGSAGLLTGSSGNVGPVGPAQLATAESGATNPPLDPDQCWGYLADGGIGRFVYVTERGPVAVPVNFRTLRKDVVFRTAARAGLAAASWQPQVSFEVDNLDDTLAEGWSVLVSGQAMIVTAPDEAAELSRLEITPWAGGDRNCYIKIVASEITGRRVRRSAGHPSAGHASHAAQA